MRATYAAMLSLSFFMLALSHVGEFAANAARYPSRAALTVIRAYLSNGGQAIASANARASPAVIQWHPTLAAPSAVTLSKWK